MPVSCASSIPEQRRKCILSPRCRSISRSCLVSLGKRKTDFSREPYGSLFFLPSCCSCLLSRARRPGAPLILGRTCRANIWADLDPPSIKASPFYDSLRSHACVPPTKNPSPLARIFGVSRKGEVAFAEQMTERLTMSPTAIFFLRVRRSFSYILLIAIVGADAHIGPPLKSLRRPHSFCSCKKNMERKTRIRGTQRYVPLMYPPVLTK